MARAVNRVVAFLLIVVGLVGVGFAINGVFAAGIGWDPGIDTRAANDMRQLSPGLTLDQAYEAVFATSEHYGLIVQWLADVLHNSFTGSTGFMSPDSRETYLWQAGVNVAFAAIAVSGLAVAIGRTLRSFLAGAFVWALLWTTPLFVGMSHVTYKDMPIAAGLTLLSAGLMLSMNQRQGAWDLPVGMVFGALGSTMALGTRISGWPLLMFVLVGSCFVAFLMYVRAGELRQAWRPIGVAAVSVVVGLVSLWLTNPLARIDMPRWLIDAALLAQATAGYDGPVRVAGGDQWSRELPWWYVPAWLGAQVPALTVLLVVGGIATLVVLITRPVAGLPRRTAGVFTPLVLQGVAAPVIIVALGSTLYNGIRHVIFIIPALIAFASLVIPPLQKRAQRSTLWLWLTAVVAVIPPMIGLLLVAQWSPYTYAYVNWYVNPDPRERPWELDGWGVTGVEGVERLRAIGAQLVAVAPSDFPVKIVGGQTYDAVRDQNPRSFGFYQFIVGDLKPLPPGCRREFTIQRGGLLLGEGATCTY